MKIRTLIKTTSILTLSLIAASTMAASNNASKPKCPIGQIAVFEQGSWHCEELSIKSNTKDTEVRSVKPARAATSSSHLIKNHKVKKQNSTKPDFKITAVKKMPSAGAFRVTVKNNGAAYGEKQANVWATHHRADGTTNGAASNMPQVFGAGEQKYIDIKFVPANIERGDRLTFTVDSFKVVAEKNENNNSYLMTFK